MIFPELIGHGSTPGSAGIWQPWSEDSRAWKRRGGRVGSYYPDIIPISVPLWTKLSNASMYRCDKAITSSGPVQSSK